MEKLTQKQRVLRVLEDSKTITSMDGFMMGIVRLTAHVFTLRREGYPIKDKWMHTRSGTKYKAFYLQKYPQLEKMKLE